MGAQVRHHLALGPRILVEHTHFSLESWWECIWPDWPCNGHTSVTEEGPTALAGEYGWGVLVDGSWDWTHFWAETYHSGIHCNRNDMYHRRHPTRQDLKPRWYSVLPVGDYMAHTHGRYSTKGWIAGQHVCLCLSFPVLILESSPLTIYSAPSDITRITSFAAIAVGNWTKALNAYAMQYTHELQLLDLQTKCQSTLEKYRYHEEERPLAEILVQVMTDGRCCSRWVGDSVHVGCCG